MKRLKHASMMSVLILCLMGMFWQVGWAGEGAPEKTNCDADITWEVVAEAKLTQFDCALGEHGGQPALIFTVGLMNPTDKPCDIGLISFWKTWTKRLGIWCPAQRQTAGNRTRKERATVKIPFIGTDKESKKILVVVKTISS